MKIGDLLNTLAGKTGQQNSKELIDVLSRADMQQIDIPDVLAQQLVSDLLSLEGAKNNVTVKAHFRAEALNGVDTEIATLVKELGIEDEVFNTEKDTYKKVRSLLPKVKEMLSKKGDGDGANATLKAELQKQVVDLNAKLAQMNDVHKTELSKVQQDHETKFMDWQVMNSLRNFKYANNDIPADVQLEIAKTLLSKELAKNEAKIVNENGVLRLMQTKDDSMRLYDKEHKPVEYSDFVSKILADSKLLAVSDPDKGKSKDPAMPFPVASNNSSQPDTSQFNATIKEAMLQ